MDQKSQRDERSQSLHDVIADYGIRGKQNTDYGKNERIIYYLFDPLEELNSWGLIA